MKLEQANKILSSNKKIQGLIKTLNANVWKPDIEVGGHFFLVNPNLDIDDSSFTEGLLDDTFSLNPPVSTTYTYLSAPAKQLVLRVSIKASELECLKRQKIALENTILKAIDALIARIGFMPFEGVCVGHYYLQILPFYPILGKDNEPDSYVLTLNSSCVKVEDMVKLNKDQYKNLLISRGI